MPTSIWAQGTAWGVLDGRILPDAGRSSLVPPAYELTLFEVSLAMRQEPPYLYRNNRLYG